jgi:hypothetical protein
MSPRPVVALIAGASFAENGGGEPRELQAALTALRAVLEREGRVLLGAEACNLVPLLLATAEYLEPRQVEGPAEAAAAPPVILAPPLADDSIESELLRDRQDRPETGGAATLLDELVAEGLCERGWDPRLESEPGAGEAFAALLSEHRPPGVIAIGAGRGIQPFVAAAENYRRRADSPRPRFFRALSTAAREELAPPWEWEPIEGRRRTDVSPLMLEGEVIEERHRDDGLLLLAGRAAEDASLALAIDEVIDAILGPETAPSRSGEPRGGPPRAPGRSPSPAAGGGT